jgi:hypothetical protein
MPRYHFNVRQGSNVIFDEEGEELPDLKAAQFEARMSARELIMEALKSDKELDGRVIEITDDAGTVIETVKLKDIISSS